MPKAGYYTPTIPPIKDISDHIVALKRMPPSIPTMRTKRGINSAFPQIRIRPGACRIFCTVFARRDIGIDFDVIFGYLVLSFGRAGAPEGIRNH